MTMKHWLLGAVAAGAIIAGWAYSAKAADLGGNCCSDLEERVAELEATAAQKGSRKVKLELSGFVSHTVMHWDDGGMTDTYIGDGGMTGSRFRFKGSAKVNPDVTAGFTYEFGINNNALGSMDQTVGGDDLGGAVLLRDSTVWLRHAKMGRVKIGHGSTATDNLILIDLSNAGVASSADPGVWNNGFFLRSDLAGGALVPLTWSNMLNQGVSFDTARRNHVSYETPNIAGFIAEAAVAEDNYWDVALRYAGEFGGFRVAGGIGYSVDTDAAVFHPVGALAFAGIPTPEIKTMVASLSVMHTASGFFVTAAGGKRDVGFSLAAGGATLQAEDPTFWHVTAGWEKNVFGFGRTTIYGEYHEAKDMIGFAFAAPGIDLNITSKANVMGVGVVQAIDAAGLDVWASYKRYSGDVDLTTTVGINGSLGVQDFSAVMGGVRLSF